MESFAEIREADCLVFLVAHEMFTRLSWADLRRMYRADGPRLLIDVKGMFSREEAEREGFRYWRL